MIFKPKMTNYAEMITKRLQLAIKLVKVAKNWLVSQIFVRNGQENFLKIVYATDGQNETLTVESAKKVEDYSELSSLITDEIEY